MSSRDRLDGAHLGEQPALMMRGQAVSLKLLVAFSTVFVLATETARGQDIVLEAVSYSETDPSFKYGYFIGGSKGMSILLEFSKAPDEQIPFVANCYPRLDTCVGDVVQISEGGERSRLELTFWFSPSLAAPEYAVESILEAKADGGLKRRADRISRVVFWGQTPGTLTTKF